MRSELDDVRYCAMRITQEEQLAGQASGRGARHAHERLAVLYRERLDILLRGDFDDEDRVEWLDVR